MSNQQQSAGVQALIEKYTERRDRDQQHLDNNTFPAGGQIITGEINLLNHMLADLRSLAPETNEPERGEVYRFVKVAAGEPFPFESKDYTLFTAPDSGSRSMLSYCRKGHWIGQYQDYYLLSPAPTSDTAPHGMLLEALKKIEYIAVDGFTPGDEACNTIYGIASEAIKGILRPAPAADPSQEREWYFTRIVNWLNNNPDWTHKTLSAVMREWFPTSVSGTYTEGQVREAIRMAQQTEWAELHRRMEHSFTPDAIVNEVKPK